MPLRVNAAHSRSVLQLAGAAVCWSLAGVLIKYIATTWPGMAVAGGRGGIAAIFLLLTNRGLRFHFSRDQLIGAVGYAVCTVTFCAATTLTSAANAILLQYTAPVWVALLSAWLLGEPARRADWLTIAVALCGMALFFKDGLTVGHAWGDALGLASGISFAAMTVALRRQKNGSAIESIILGNILGFVIGLPWIVRAPLLPPSGWLALGLLGTLQLGFSYWLFARAIKYVTALEAVLIPVIEPVLNPLWVLIFLHERPSFWTLAGGTLVVVAVIVRAMTALQTRGKTGGTTVHREKVQLMTSSTSSTESAGPAPPQTNPPPKP